MIAIFLFFTATFQVSSHEFQDLTIIVNSCDKYEELWDPFFKILFLKWQKLEQGSIPIILITNTKKFNHPAVQVFNSENEVSWSDTVKKALKTVKTQYVLYLQEDYFLVDLNLERLSQLFSLMKEEKIGYMQLYGGTKENRELFPKGKGLFYKNQFEQWRTSLQAGFWNKNLFSHLLDCREKIWDFEIKGSVRSEGSMLLFTVVMDDIPLTYLNMAAEGCLVDENIETIKKLYGIEWQRNLPLYSDFSLKRFWQKKVLPVLYWDFWMPFKTLIKSVI
ncbi:MAG: hypothetical protein HYS39_02700 [Proteobacteria bacterium]|nr:hypothetical protein [Pseudomonadota bacterium]